MRSPPWRSRIAYPGFGNGYMDSVSDGTELNVQMGFPVGQALRVRNPSSTRTLLLSLPTTGYQNIVLRYAVRHTPNGARMQRLYYQTEEGGPWLEFGDLVQVLEDFEVFTFDFTGIEGVSDNPDFTVGIHFLGPEAEGSSGNNRFDNISLDGIPLGESPGTSQLWLVR